MVLQNMRCSRGELQKTLGGEGLETYRVPSSAMGENGPPIQVLNKFCKIYISGFDSAKELRERLMASKSADELLKLVGEV